MKILVAEDDTNTRNGLVDIFENEGYETETLDPDNIAEKEFGFWLRASMDELIAAGWGFTCDPDEITVYLD